jgi:hypothetical protein
VQLEFLAIGVDATLSRIGTVHRRDGRTSPDGGVLVDCAGEFDDPAVLAGALDSTLGVVAHGLLPPELVRTVLIGRGVAVERVDQSPWWPGGAVTAGSVVRRRCTVARIWCSWLVSKPLSPESGSWALVPLRSIWGRPIDVVLGDGS